MGNTNPLTITFLGTGTSQGIPVIACDCHVCKSTNAKDKRFRSSVLLESKNTRVLIDIGPDFRQQMLQNNVQSLDAIVLTHEHKDHIAGLDDVRAFNFKQGKPMDVYCFDRVAKAIKRDFRYVFYGRKYPGIPEVNIKTITNTPFSIGQLNFTPIEVMHYKMPIFGYRVGNFTYITDANHIAKKELDKVRGSKVFVLNALRKEKHISHFNLQEAVAIIQDIQPQNGYLTHISHFLGTHAKVSKELATNVNLAYDGLQLNI